MSLNDFSAANALEATALFVLPEARSTLSPVSKTEPKRVPTQRLEITRIPQAMRKMGWFTSARLMERWFSTPAWKMPENVKSRHFDERTLNDSHVDTSIVTMSWASRFQRFRDALEQVESLSFKSPNGLGQLKARLAGWDGRTPFTLGSRAMNVRDLDASCQVNYTSFGSLASTLDDMYGALGSAALKLAVTGTAMNVDDRRIFKSDFLAFYIQDHYDFNGSQYLGTWTKERVLTKAETAFAETYTGRRIVEHRDGPFCKVTNADFAQFRQRAGIGGDFVLYSDVLWKPMRATVFLDSTA